MGSFYWNEGKNRELKEHRGITFEGIAFWLDNGGLRDIVDSPNQKQHPGQKAFVIETPEYWYLVPFVKDGERTFLKTVVPSRKIKKKYSKGKKYGL